MRTPDPAMQAVMERITARRAGLPNRYALAFPEARSQLLFEREPWLADGPACASTDRDTGYAGRHFAMRVVKPERISGEWLLVYLHGGGWCVGSSVTHDNIVRRLATLLGCEAWSIDYALAPEAPFPAGLLDCVAAIELAAQRHPALRIVVAGDSAGAHLALAAALRLRDQARPLINALLLFYGVYTDDCNGVSMRSYADGRYGLSLQAHQRYLDACFGPTGGRDRASAFALHNQVDLRSLPRTWLTAAELDILRDQSHALSTKLQAARVAVEVDEVPGVIHGFLSYGQLLPQAGQALAAAARWVHAAA
jgi:acetyl esterase